MKGNKLSALVDRNGLPLACTVVPANIHDSRLYEPTLEAFEIPEVQGRPAIISADAAYDARNSSVQPETRNQEQYPGQPEVLEISKARETVLV